MDLLRSRKTGRNPLTNFPRSDRGAAEGRTPPRSPPSPGQRGLGKKKIKKMQGTDLVQDGFERREGARERAWPTGGRKANKFGSVQMAAPANLTGLTSRQTIVVPRQYGPSPNYRYHNHHNTKPAGQGEQSTATQRAGQRDRACEGFRGNSRGTKEEAEGRRGKEKGSHAPRRGTKRNRKTNTTIPTKNERITHARPQKQEQERKHTHPQHAR